jgi:CMP-N-acetylneuraminic acid synthetase
MNGEADRATQAPRGLGIIPARGGSKRFPRKNVAPLAGRPLLVWTIAAARAAEVFTDLIVSSDDAEALSLAEASGAEPRPRAARLADDVATVDQVCVAELEALANVGRVYDAVYVLLPTAPLRSAASIRRAWDRFVTARAEALISVVPANHPVEWSLARDGDWLKPMDPEGYRQPRSALPQRWHADGGHIIVRCDHLLKTGGWSSPRTVAFTAPADETVDIDTPRDLRWAEFLLQAGIGKKQ